MDPRQQCAHHSLCITCRTERTGNLTIRGVSPLGRFLILALSLSLCIAEVSMQPATETLCGGELVDTLQFVCGERGFYFSRPHPRGGRRFQGGIVEECCFRSCALELLEQYCAKPTVTERDLSRHIMPAAHTETINRAYPVRLSLWPRQSIQRLRRGVPAAKSRALRRALLAEGYRASEDGALHRPLGGVGVGVGVGGGGSLLEGRSLKDGHQSIRPVPLLHRRSPHSHQEEDEEEAAIMALLGYRPSRLHGRKDARRRRPLTELFQTHTARK